MRKYTLLSDKAISDLVTTIKNDSVFDKVNQSSASISIISYYYVPGSRSRGLIIKTLEELSSFIVEKVVLSKDDLKVIRKISSSIHCIYKDPGQPSYIRDLEIEPIICFYWGIELILCNILSLPFQEQDDKLIPLESAYGCCTNNIASLGSCRSRFVNPLTTIRNNIHTQTNRNT